MLALADMAADKNPRGGAFEDLEANELQATFFEFRSRVLCPLEEISNSRRRGDRLRETSVGGAHRQPPGFSFAQQFTVETLLLTGTAAWGTGYSDPSGIGGNYALGMLSSAQNDLLGLSFDAQDYAYFNLKLDISSVDINGIGGPFVSAGSVPVFEFTLYDNPTGATGLGSGTILDVQQATGTASAQDVLDWTNVILPLDASGSTNGNVTLRMDMLSGGYAALDNFLIVASDVAGDVSAVPEPTTAISVGLLSVVGFVGNRRRRRSATV